jgi:hypothetical protein
MMAPEGMAAILRAPNQLCYFGSFFNYFVHEVAATISYDRKEFLDIRTLITHFELEKDFSLMSLTRRIYCFPENRPNSPSLA